MEVRLAQAAVADETRSILQDILELILRNLARPELRKHNSDGPQLTKELALSLPDKGQGLTGLREIVKKVLENSVNTSHDGFMDKLFTAPLPPGIAAELVLATLNTNLNVYSVSPALTVVEKHTAKLLCKLFGLPEEISGGVCVPGGSAANQTALITARSALYPETKTHGNGNHRFVCFTSEHGHYSVEKSALMSGLGTNAVIKVPVDDDGRMDADVLESLVIQSKKDGYTPFFVNCTAGTTVYGAFDPFQAISEVCGRHNLWMHTDAAWGSALVFSDKLKRKSMAGIQQSDSITFDAHKMLGVPILCSYLLVKDPQRMHKANSLPATYLFHGSADDGDIYDLADLTFQCGRRGDALKLAMCWQYYGKEGFQRQNEEIYENAQYLTASIKSSPFLSLANPRLDPPPCSQVCFYADSHSSAQDSPQRNSAITQHIVCELKKSDFMVDYASGADGDFLRVVVNRQTSHESVDRLIAAITSILQAEQR